MVVCDFILRNEVYETTLVVNEDETFVTYETE